MTRAEAGEREREEREGLVDSVSGERDNLVNEVNHWKKKYETLL